ncbi:ATP-binding protein [Pseudaquabacterium rugosum]|uniref:histidine kinase n=1 Tax=Pseudaquabacterium rugosum TaxID=2984194 RepID=A0ABU9BHZ8_9BURK
MAPAPTPPLPELAPADRTSAGDWTRGALAWIAGASAASVLDGQADLGSQALPLVLAGALASLWWPGWAAAMACAAAVAAFNWTFVPPRGSLQVSLGRDAVLLAVMLAVSLGAAWGVARQRRLTSRLRLHAAQVRQLYRLSAALREAEDTPAVCAALTAALRSAAPDRPADTGPVVVPAAWLTDDLAPGPAAAPLLADLSPDQRSGLALCIRQGQALGPGTGRYETQHDLYLPVRGPQSVNAAVLLRRPAGIRRPDPGATEPAAWRARREQAEALCDLAGEALERLQAAEAARQARRQAEAHALRGTWLAAVAHDHRTPLATIVSAASSLATQGERLSPTQRQRLAETIVDEAGQLARLTDNALQLTRLDGTADAAVAGAALTRDWESLEELTGAVLRRVRTRDPARRVHARLAGPLPLMRCDGVLLVQLMENLIDNALKYSPPEAPVELLCRRQGEQVLIAVRDRGPGIPAGERARLLQPFERGPDARRAGVRGAGLGLALAQAVARAHGSTLRLRARGHGGTSAELLLPVQPSPPTIAGDEEAAT